MFLLAASYYFYMQWKPEYALLLLTSTAITYGAALLIDKYRTGDYYSSCQAKVVLILSIVANFAILFFYKYYNWLGGCLTEWMQKAGVDMTVPRFDILLPVGISFYIFQALGYSIDVYRKNVEVERNFFRYALFVSYFPQLVAGPIERSTNLLRQFHEKKEPNYDNLMQGLNLMLWGYFMKLVVADRCAMYVDAIFNNAAHHTGVSFAVASVMFTIQIYGDFAGYTYIAIGCAKVMGFHLHDNFHRPYFAATITEFWHRWHISLSSWLRDYVYFPLGGSRTSKAKAYRNILITFLVSGIWHGANWTYIFWGVMHGVVQCIERFWGWNKARWKGLAKFLHVLVTFVAVDIAWIFFRADSIEQAFYVIKEIFSDMQMPFDGLGITGWMYIVFALMVLVIKECIDEFNINLHLSQSKSLLVQRLYVIGMVMIILCFGVLNGGQFIYFQF